MCPRKTEAGRTEKDSRIRGQVESLPVFSGVPIWHLCLRGLPSSDFPRHRSCAQTLHPNAGSEVPRTKISKWSSLGKPAFCHQSLHSVTIITYGPIQFTQQPNALNLLERSGSSSLLPIRHGADSCSRMWNPSQGCRQAAFSFSRLRLFPHFKEPDDIIL